MFHHDDRVVEVAQLFERLDEPVVVTLVQTDAWLVEDIQHVDQLRTDLCGQSYALALTARKGGRLTVERKIVEPHFEHEVYAGNDFLDDFLGNSCLSFVKMLLGFNDPGLHLKNVHTGHFGNVLVPNAV